MNQNNQPRPSNYAPNLSPVQNYGAFTGQNTNLSTVPITTTTLPNYHPYYGPQYIKIPNVIQTVREVVVTPDQSAQIKQLEAIIARQQLQLETYKSKLIEYETIHITTRTEIERLQSIEVKFNMVIDENNRLKKSAADYNLLNLKYDDSLKTIKYYETQHSKWQEFINMKQTENETIKQQYLQLEYAYKQLQLQDAEKQNRIDELNSNLELTRQSHVENVKRSEIITRKRIETLEDELKQVKRQLDQANSDIQNWHSKYLQTENEKQELNNRNLHLEDQINLLTQELERILNAVKAKTEELDTYKKQCSQLETQLFVVQSLEGEINHLREIIQAREREIEDWRVRYTKQLQTIDDLRKTNSTISDYETQISMMTNELERLHQMLKQKQEESENLKQTIYKHEVTITQLRNLEQDKILLENKVTLLAQEIQRLTMNNNKKNDEIENYKQRISKLELEVNSLSPYQNECSRLRDYIDNKNKEIEEYRRKIQQLEIEAINYEDQVRELENKIALLSTEIERFTQMNTSKYEQIEEWKRRCIQLESRLNSLLNVEEDNRRINEFLDITKRERDELRSQLVKSERQIFESGTARTELENQVTILSTEITRLLGIINDRNKSIESNKSTILNLEQRISELRILESRVQDYEYKLTLLTQELERLSNAYKAQCEELDQSNQRINRLEIENSHISHLESDVKRIRELYQSSQREISDLKEKIFKLEQIISELRRYEQLQIELENQIALLSTQIERKDLTLRQRNEEMETLRQKISQLQMAMYQIRDYEERIQYLSQEIDRVNEKNQQYDEELRTWRYKYVEVNELQNRNQDLLARLVLANSIIEMLNTNKPKSGSESGSYDVVYRSGSITSNSGIYQY